MPGMAGEDHHGSRRSGDLDFVGMDLLRVCHHVSGVFADSMRPRHKARGAVFFCEVFQEPHRVVADPGARTQICTEVNVESLKAVSRQALLDG